MSRTNSAEQTDEKDQVTESTSVTPEVEPQVILIPEIVISPESNPTNGEETVEVIETIKNTRTVTDEDAAQSEVDQWNQIQVNVRQQDEKSDKIESVNEITGKTDESLLCIDIEEKSLENESAPVLATSSIEEYHSIESEKPKADPSPEEEMLMDESIILVPDSPQQTNMIRPRDSTFSPIVDTSIHDSRPHIEVSNEKSTPALKSVALRTSTPLPQRAQQNDGTPVKRSLSIVPNLLIKAVTSNMKFALLEKEAEEAENGDISEIRPNPLEKSILKSSRRKRSLSVTDGESFIQKRVVFNSPKFIEINTIDERLMASFMEEKENAFLKQAATASGRKRSLSTGTPMKGKVQSKVKMPNFKAIHEQQFEKMESIADHANRKAERAKKLATPVRDGPSKSPRPALKVFSKIPTFNARKLELVPSVSEANLHQRSRLLKRSLSDNTEEPPRKKTQVAPYPAWGGDKTKRQIAVVSGLQRANSESSKLVGPQISLATFGLKKRPSTEDVNRKPALKTQSLTQINRTKVEDRREKNMSLFKSKAALKPAATQRAMSANMLKGVRLNRRFELQMQHRRDQDEA